MIHDIHTTQLPNSFFFLPFYLGMINTIFWPRNVAMLCIAQFASITDQHFK